MSKRTILSAAAKPLCSISRCNRSYYAWNKFKSLSDELTNDCSLAKSSGTDTYECVDLLSEKTAREYNCVLRKWETITPPVQCFMEGVNLRVCSYNVLCQVIALEHSHMYTHLVGWDNSVPLPLRWSFRSDLLIQELGRINADVFCLQEVQHDHFEHFLQHFARSGYNGKYKKKTGLAIDGCAIFYKSKFECMNYIPVEYFIDENYTMNRNNVGQIMRLKDKSSGTEFCVANTHLLYNMKRGDVKFGQLIILLANLDKECGPKSENPCPVIICGDFNIPFGCPIYEFLLGAPIFSNQMDSLNLLGESGDPMKGWIRCVSLNEITHHRNIGRNCRHVDPNEVCYQDLSEHHGRPWHHSFSLADSYGSLEPERNEIVSTFTALYGSNPDFIFYSVLRKDYNKLDNGVRISVSENQDLHLVRRLALPSLSSLKVTFGPWPNIATPSDHVPLIAEFIVKRSIGIEDLGENTTI